MGAPLHREFFRDATRRPPARGPPPTLIVSLARRRLCRPCRPGRPDFPSIDPRWCVDDLVTYALTNRPELADRQALVQATLQRLRQERLRPLVRATADHNRAQFRLYRALG